MSNIVGLYYLYVSVSASFETV